MKNKALYIVMGFVVILGMTLLTNPMPADSAKKVASPSVLAIYAAGADCLDPNDPSWALAPANTSTMKHVNYTDSACGGGGGYESFQVSVQAVHNGTDICFRMGWPDVAMDDVIDDVDKFADAVAVQVAFGGQTSLQMGNQNNPVNIMFWRADLAQPQNIVAGGIGTVQVSPDAQNISSYSNWAANAWDVIISRPMIAASTNQVTFARGMKYPVVFGNWEGWDFERDGHKTITNWTKLDVQ